MARKVTYALAASFKEYSKRVKEEESRNAHRASDTGKKFTINLRSTDESAHADENQETEA